MTKLENIYYLIVTKHDTSHRNGMIGEKIDKIKGRKHIWTINTQEEFRQNPHKERLRQIEIDYSTHNLIVVDVV